MANQPGNSTVKIDNSSNELIVYYHNYSYYSQKVLMVLYEKKLPFKTVTVNLIKGGQYESWFLSLNPRGEVPVLQDGIKIIPDSVRIIDYIEDNFSNGNTPRLIPIDSGSEVRQKVIYFRNIIDQLPIRVLTMGSFFHSELVSCPKLPFVGPVRGSLANAEKNIGKVLREYAIVYPHARDTLLQKAEFHEQKKSNLTNKTEYLTVLEQFAQVLDSVENELGNHTGDKENWWLCSEQFTVADVALTVLLERLNVLGYESKMWENNVRPFIEKYYSKVKERESYKQIIPPLSFHIKMFLLRYQKPLIVISAVGLTVLAGIVIYFI